MVSHLVVVHTPAAINAELCAWLRITYDRA
jgi:hypothetical protein